MAGISSKAIGKLENRFKFNDGTELNKDLDLNWYETVFRSYDPQIGRFHQIDPYAEEFDDWSPYNFSLNNPILLNDPTGLEPEPPEDRTKRTNLDPVYVTAKVSPWKQYLNRMRVAQQLGMEEPVVFKGDSKRTQREMQRIHGYETRKNEMDRAVGEAEIEIVSLALPIGKLGQGIRWLYRLRKGNQIVKAIQGTIETANGIKITGFTKHAVDRAIERAVKPGSILDAIKNPLKIGEVVTDQLGRQSQRFIGQFGEVVVNPNTGKIVSVNPTSSSKAAKLLKQLEQ